MKERSKGKLLQRMLIQCRTMIEYAHFTILNGNSVKDNQVMLKLLSKYVLELEYLHSFEIHILFTNYKEKMLEGFVTYSRKWSNLISSTVEQNDIICLLM